MAMSHINSEPLLWKRGNFHLVSALIDKAWLLENNGHFGNCQFSSRVNCYRVGAVWFPEAVISWAPISIRTTLLTSLQRWADNSTVLWLTYEVHLSASSHSSESPAFDFCSAPSGSKNSIKEHSSPNKISFNMITFWEKILGTSGIILPQWLSLFYLE